jgi:hypothetical protein
VVIYAALGIKMTYKPAQRTVLVESRPAPRVGVKAVSEGGLEPPRP